MSVVESELAQEIVKLRPGDHLCLFYEKDPRERMPALVPFIQDGLSATSNSFTSPMIRRSRI